MILKITYILNRSDFMGDANAHLLDLAHGGRRAGHDVTILVGRDGVFFKSFRERGISCFPLKHIKRDIELVSDPFETWLPKGYWDSWGRGELR